MSLVEETKEIQAFIKVHPQITDQNKKEVSALYLSLIDCIVDHNHQYYVENTPIISDKEYDELFDYLKKIEEYFPQLISSNSPTQALVGQYLWSELSVSQGFKQAQHKVKLASLENTYNAQDIRERDERIGRILQTHPNPSAPGHTLLRKLNSPCLIKKGQHITYRVEPKFDGLSVELIYEKWKFVQAITRGDGYVWDDITENVKTIKNIPHTLNHLIDIHVRGEIMMPKSVWKTLNKEREENGDTPFANTRNAAAGSIKLLDSREVERRKLLCFVYDILRTLPSKSPYNGDFSSPLETLWLPVFDWLKIGKNIDEVIALCEDEKIKKNLEAEDIDFDGLVIKVEDTDLREVIWSTDHHPRWAVAYKFPAQVIATQVNSVDFQVGRTWIITPVANLEAVELSGVTIKRVSLHNFDFIHAKDIYVHDRVRLQRSGEVIPYIVSTISDRRPLDAQKISMPTICPSCGSEVFNEDIHYYCKNPHCPAQIKEKIIHFVSKNCMDIEGIGESTIDILVDQWLLKNVADIYTLVDPQVQFKLRSFPWFADKKVFEIIKQIEESKKQPLWRLLNGLGISGVGKKTAIDLVKSVNEKEKQTHHHKWSPALLDCSPSLTQPRWTEVREEIFDSLLNILTDEEFLRGIYGIGEKIVLWITEFFAQNMALLRSLESAGVNFDASRYIAEFVDEKASKWYFSITWTFPISREKIIQEMQKNWYLFHDSPIKTTDFMLIGESAGSKKIKAESLGLKIYEWRDLVVKEFLFLKGIVAEVVAKPKAQSLF